MALKFEGKKLLILGSNVGVNEIIKYARQNGAYTIVADYLPVEKSIPKQNADENLLISTADIEALCNYVINNNVDGVLAGISEFNLLQALEIAEKCNLSFYCTKDQWHLVEQKDKFRELCNQNNVPCPKTYYHGGNVDELPYNSIPLPVVVKPVDASASMGVSICFTPQELKEGITLAIQNSNSKSIIIEEYVDGEEFSAHYVIVDGKPTLSSIDNRYPVKINKGNVTSIPAIRVYPSDFIDQYIQSVDRHMIALCKSLNLRNAVLFIQGFYNRNDNKFNIFEAGLRPAAEYPARLIKTTNNLDFTQILVDNALASTVTEYDLSKENPYLNGMCGSVVSLVSMGGEIGNITGFSEASEIPGVIVSELRYHKGDITPYGNTLRQILMRFVVQASDRRTLSEIIDGINNLINVTDTNDNNMVIKPNPRVILS